MEPNEAYSTAAPDSSRLIGGLVVIPVISSVFLVANVILAFSGDTSWIMFSSPYGPPPITLYVWPAMLVYGIPCMVYTLLICPNRRGIIAGFLSVIGAGLATIPMFFLPRGWMGVETLTALEVFVVSGATILAFSVRQNAQHLATAGIIVATMFMAATAYFVSIFIDDRIFESVGLAANYIIPAWMWLSAWFWARRREETRYLPNLTAWILSLAGSIGIAYLFVTVWWPSLWLPNQ